MAFSPSHAHGSGFGWERCENGSLFEPFMYKNDLFAKTGSGQTQGTHSKKGIVLTGGFCCAPGLGDCNGFGLCDHQTGTKTKKPLFVRRRFKTGRPLQTEHLPRQAWDTHRESTQKGGRFLAGACHCDEWHEGPDCGTWKLATWLFTTLVSSAIFFTVVSLGWLRLWLRWYLLRIIFVLENS
eukprot:COSAG06_NODE_5716_length_3308_cov_1.833281_2_plen_182_part_00